MRKYLLITSIFFYGFLNGQNVDLKITAKLGKEYNGSVLLLRTFNFTSGEFSQEPQKLAALADNGYADVAISISIPTLIKLSVDNGKSYATFGIEKSEQIDIDLKNGRPSYSGGIPRTEILQLSRVSNTLQDKYFGELKNKMMQAMNRGDSDSASYYLNVANDKIASFKVELEEVVDKTQTGTALFYALENVLDQNKNREFFIKKATLLASKYKDSEMEKYLSKKIEFLNHNKIGASPLAINIKDIEGQAMDFSKYRGKYLLIDFWASWCLACRQQHPAMVDLYNNTSRNKFEIIGISMDNEADLWNKAIKKDHLPWRQFFDREQSVSNLYGVSSLPQNFLIDKEGKIVLKNVDVKQIRSFLEQN